MAICFASLQQALAQLLMAQKVEHQARQDALAGLILAQQQQHGGPPPGGLGAMRPPMPMNVAQQQVRIHWLLCLKC